MTREEAKNTGWMQGSRKGLDNIIDAIYDDFESRTCSNCKHYHRRIKTGSEGFCNNSNNLECEYIYNDLEFGCNKWEQK